MKLAHFYEELRIFNDDHVGERKLPNCERGFNRSAFAARIVTRGEAVLRIFHALTVEAKLPPAQWPAEMKFMATDKNNPNEPLFRLPTEYKERHLRGSRPASRVIRDEPPGEEEDEPEDADEPAAERKRSKQKKKTPVRLGRTKSYRDEKGWNVMECEELKTDRSQTPK